MRAALISAGGLCAKEPGWRGGGGGQFYSEMAINPPLEREAINLSLKIKNSF